jgi:predicted AAA+ superfamily ATPase
MIARLGYQSSVREALARAPIVSLLGPRQVGKTTLARIVAEGRRAVFFDLEKPTDI